jgi:hypothetical protein
MIQTVPFPLTVTISLPQNIPFTGPMQLYLNQPQYIRITVIANYNIPIGYALKLSIPSASLFYGSAYANTSTVNATTVIYGYTANSLVISNFALIPSGSTISVTIKVKVNSASVVVSANIDQYSNINTVTPLYTGTSSIVTAATPATIMTGNYPTSSGGENYMLNSMQTGTSNFIFQVYPTDTSTGSFIDIYM